MINFYCISIHILLDCLFKGLFWKWKCICIVNVVLILVFRKQTLNKQWQIGTHWYCVVAVYLVAFNILSVKMVVLESRITGGEQTSELIHWNSRRWWGVWQLKICEITSTRICRNRVIYCKFQYGIATYFNLYWFTYWNIISHNIKLDEMFYSEYYIASSIWANTLSKILTLAILEFMVLNKNIQKQNLIDLNSLYCYYSQTL